MKKLPVIIALFGLLLIISCVKKSPNETPPENNIHPQVDIPWPSLADSPWPMFHHDPQSTGRSPYIGPRTGKIKWTFEPGGLIFSSIVIGLDSTIYFTCHYEETQEGPKSFLYAVSPKGVLNWKIQLEIGSESQSLVASDGTIYIAAGPTYDLYAINPDGTIKETFDFGDFHISPFLKIGIDGTIFFAGSDGYFYAATQQGQILWKIIEGDGFVMLNAPISPDGNTIYIFCWEQLPNYMALCAVNTNSGVIKWKYALLKDEWCTYSPLTDSEGNIFFGTGQICDQPGFYSLSPEGIFNWKYPGWCSREPAIDHKGNIYFELGTNTFSLVCLDFWGKLKWENSNLNLPNSTTHIVDAQGIVYRCTVNSVEAYQGDGTIMWQVPLSGQVTRIASPAIDANGTLYVGTYANKSKLYAIQ